jgi:hypothetical protein
MCVCTRARAYIILYMISKHNYVSVFFSILFHLFPLFLSLLFQHSNQTLTYDTPSLYLKKKNFEQLFILSTIFFLISSSHVIYVHKVLSQMVGFGSHGMSYS